MVTGLRLIRHGLVDSTNERAFAALDDGSGRHLDLHVAAGQTAGRGSRGRRWESEEGGGLYASLILLPEPPAPPPPLFTMGSGLVLLDVVRGLGLEGAVLKWPNDLMAGGAKLGGILVEARGLQGDRTRVVMGMGLNVTQRRFSPELEAERTVASLGLLGIEVSPEAALERLLAALPARLEQLRQSSDDLTADYLEATRLLEGPVEVHTGKGDARVGRILALDVPTGLVLEGSDGKRHRMALEHVIAIETSL